MAPGFRIIDFVSQLTFATTISITQRVPAGLTCLNEVAAGLPRAALSSRTSCHPFRASRRLMKPGDPFTTGRENNYTCKWLHAIIAHQHLNPSVFPHI